MGLPLMSVEKAAERLTMTKSTLDKWRVRGVGPHFIRMGRSIRYAASDLDRWLAENTRASTSDGANDNEEGKR